MSKLWTELLLFDAYSACELIICTGITRQLGIDYRNACLLTWMTETSKDIKHAAEVTRRACMSGALGLAYLSFASPDNKAFAAVTDEYDLPK
eukprot:scaffold79513_cov25-Prasinocladus_malaysianus.AAC.1